MSGGDELNCVWKELCVPPLSPRVCSNLYPLSHDVIEIPYQMLSKGNHPEYLGGPGLIS